MSNEIINPTPAIPQVFQYQNHEVRTVDKDGEVWFALKDICSILGIEKTSDIARRLDDDEKGVDSIDTPTGKQQMTIINESGLYSTIMRSAKPEAKPFRKWVTSEVLPSIRKHGSYSVAHVANSATLPSNPIDVLKLHYDVLVQHDNEIKSLTSRASQTEDMALEASTKVDELQATFRLHEWQMTDLREAVHTKSKELQKDSGDPIGKFFALVWGFLKRYFRVSSYKGIPAIRFEEAKLIVTNLTKEQVGVTK